MQCRAGRHAARAPREITGSGSNSTAAPHPEPLVVHLAMLPFGVLAQVVHSQVDVAGCECVLPTTPEAYKTIKSLGVVR